MNEPSLSIRSLLDRSAGQRPAPKPAEDDSISDTDEYVALAAGRIGNRPQWTLVFQQADGAVRGFPYAQFDGIRSDDPCQGFTITFAEYEVTVTGCNLSRLFTRVCEHRAATIVAAARSQGLQAGADDPLVWSITYHPRREAPTLPSR